MAGGFALKITVEMANALDTVLGGELSVPIVLLSRYIDSLAKEFGLSENQSSKEVLDDDPLERAKLDLPDSAVSLVRHYLPESGEPNADGVRGRLYGAFVELSRDSTARRHVGDVLRLGQIYWCIEGCDERPLLPIRPKGAIAVGGKTAAADIRVPGENKDFATMRWTARTNQVGAYKSSSGAMRREGARLAVLAAKHIIDANPAAPPDLANAVLERTISEAGKPRISIVWLANEPRGSRFDTQQVLEGAPVEAGADYQPRGFDADLERLWDDGGDRRVWLRGGPGLGKSYSARRTMQQARADQSPDREVLLIWVNSADPSSTAEAFAAAADQLRHRAVPVAGNPHDTAERKARALLGTLSISTWRWLVVLDNADAGSLIEAGLVPPGSNPNGRALMTTLSPDRRLGSHGRVVVAELFTPEEAEAYLRGEVHSRGRGSGLLARATPEETAALAETLGHHPLALSIAAATIVANAMTIPEWLDEFAEAEQIDDAADGPDMGGYPHKIGATWRIALSKASLGMPQGVVERAALVAALQDPDGHPTWLWDRDSVAAWVAGAGTQAGRPRRIPEAIQRLMDGGVVELLTDTWTDGRVAIHQLAARAIRESAAPQPQTELAGILAEEWLLRLTENPPITEHAILRRNLQPISTLADLPDQTRAMVKGLLEYGQPRDVGIDRRQDARLAPFLEQGGTTGRMELAKRRMRDGDDHAEHGQPKDAAAAYRQAVDLYRDIVGSGAIEDSKLADCLLDLAKAETHLGDPEAARASRKRAVVTLNRIVLDTDFDTASRRLRQLAEALQHLNDETGEEQVLAQVEALLAEPDGRIGNDAPILDPVSRGSAWSHLATILSDAGRDDQASECLSREIALYEQFPRRWRSTLRSWAEAIRRLAMLRARAGDWAAAEAALLRLPDQTGPAWIPEEDRRNRPLHLMDRHKSRVLLASVYMHLGRREEARRGVVESYGNARRPTIHKPDNNPENKTIAEVPHRSSDEADEAERFAQMTENEQEAYLAELEARLAEMNASLAEQEAKEAEEAARCAEEAAEEAEEAARWAEEEAAEAAKEAAEEAEYERLDDIHTLSGLVFDAWRKWRWGDAAGLQHGVNILRQQRASELPADIGREADVAEGLAEHAWLLHRNGSLAEAVSQAEQAIRIYRLLADLEPNHVRRHSDLADVLGTLSTVQGALGQDAAAAEAAALAVSSRRQALTLNPGDKKLMAALATALDQLADVNLSDLGRSEKAVELYRESLGIRRLLAGQAPENTGLLVDLARSHTLLGQALHEIGDPHSDIVQLSQAVALLRDATEREPDGFFARVDLERSLRLLGEFCADDGELEQGLEFLTQAVNTLQLLADQDPPKLLGIRAASEIRQGLAELLVAALDEQAHLLRSLGRDDEAHNAEARARDLEASDPEKDDS